MDRKSLGCYSFHKNVNRSGNIHSVLVHANHTHNAMIELTSNAPCYYINIRIQQRGQYQHVKQDSISSIVC